MRRLGHCRFSIFIIAVGLLVGIGIRLSPTMSAAPASGPDFRRSDSDLSHPLRIIVYGDMRFTDPIQTRGDESQGAALVGRSSRRGKAGCRAAERRCALAWRQRGRLR